MTHYSTMLFTKLHHFASTYQHPARLQLTLARAFHRSGFYTMGPPVELGSENPFCVMKAVGYARLPTAKNDDGLVTLRLSKKESDVR